MEDRDLGPAENLPESPDDHVADEEVGDEGDDDGAGFTFPALPFAADGCTVPVYPVFGRPPSPPAPETATVRLPLGRLLLEEREFRARQRDLEVERPPLPDEDGGELEGVAPDSYCLWAPGGQSAPSSPLRCRKSGSTGSVLRWRSISDRLVGRSQSDGKEKFVFFSAAGSGSGSGPPKQVDEEGEGGRRKGEGDVGVGDRGSWSYYGKGGGGASGGTGGRRRSYLPYKQELVGLFANVSGLRRSYPPF